MTPSLRVALSQIGRRWSLAFLGRARRFLQSSNARVPITPARTTRSMAPPDLCKSSVVPSIQYRTFGSASVCGKTEAGSRGAQAKVAGADFAGAVDRLLKGSQ